VAKAALKVLKDRAREWIWLQSMTDKDKWSLDHVPDGESHAPRIKLMSENSDRSKTFYVYRDMKPIGARKNLEDAKKLARAGKPDPEVQKDHRAMLDYVDKGDRDVALFKKLSATSQKAIADIYPWALPRKTDMDAKGVRVKTTRTDLKNKSEVRAEKLALPMESKIKVLKPNPKKEGSAPFARWTLLYQHDGKTVEDFIKQGGNPTTLANAVKAKCVQVKGME
jgi:hypothetical protein